MILDRNINGYFNRVEMHVYFALISLDFPGLNKWTKLFIRTLPDAWHSLVDDAEVTCKFWWVEWFNHFRHVL